MDKRIKLYKPCENCEGHSYLTSGGFYLCIRCGHKEVVIVEDNNIQKEL